MEYLTSIIDIVKPIGVINAIDSQTIIEFRDIKLTHGLIDKQLYVSSADYQSWHILRLIANKLGLKYNIWINPSIQIPYELIGEYFIELKELFELNCYDYCTICANPHDKLGLNYITTCSNPICITKSYHYPTNNRVTEFYKSDSNTIILLFKSLLSALTHPKVEKIITQLPKIYSISDIKTLKENIPKELLENNLDPIIKIISESYDDFYLWAKLDNNLVYALLINAISDNYYSMYSYRDLVNTDLKKKNLTRDADDDVEYFNVNYSTEIENEIKAKLDNGAKYYYLYHGSPFHCWYSIIKNGLKVMSQTEFMTTGAVYGNGIYLSDYLATSYSYARVSPPFSYSIVGLFQVIENPDKYKKTTGIFVVPDEKILILRSLIKINKPIKSHVFYAQMDNYFIMQRTVDKRMSDINLITLKNKRLSAELKLIEKNSEKFKVSYCSDEQEIPWEIELYVGDQIYKMELGFHNYPLSPPLFKMKDFTLQPKGIIDTKFKINLPILEVGTWGISNKLADVILIIWTFLSNSY
jgi:ubiquitin-protein ligase